MDADSRTLIDQQFDRAVEIVQNLPTTGPIQTGYEDKLKMYGLYKQATVGNVQTPRPSMFDMLGRAKWDAWTKNKDLDSYEAKVLYVDALLKVLRRYSDKTIAMDFVRELESYNQGAADLVMSGSLSRSRSSSVSSLSSGEAGPSGYYRSSDVPAHLRNNATNPMSLQPDDHLPRPPLTEEHIPSEGEADDEIHHPLPTLPYARNYPGRPQSSLSSHRYRTPMASVLMSPPPPMSMSVPPQPRPAVELPSAFQDHTSGSIPTTSYPPSIVSYPSARPYSQLVGSGSVPHHNPQHAQAPYHNTGQVPFPGRQLSLPGGMPPRSVLERAVENLQAHIAALNERMELLESTHRRSSSSLISHPGSRSPQWRGFGRGGSSPAGRGDPHAWDIDDMGMWSLVLTPLSRVVARFEQLMRFVMYNENRSPTLVVIRRLFLDISFLLCLLAVVKMVWRRSGVRRREVVGALRGLWWAVVGRKQQRVLVDRAV